MSVRVTGPRTLKQLFDPVLVALLLVACGVVEPARPGGKPAETVANVTALGFVSGAAPAPGKAFDPTIALRGEDLWVAWVDSKEGGSTREAHDHSKDTEALRRVLIARSVDGGKSFAAPVTVAEDEPGGLATIRSHSGGPAQVALGPAGELYVLWAVNGAADAISGITSLYLARSDDGGATFSAPTRISTDLASASVDYHNLMVDGAGKVTIGFLDFRNEYDDDDASAAVEVRTVQSTDGRRSFSPREKLAELACECCRVSLPGPGSELLPAGGRSSRARAATRSAI